MLHLEIKGLPSCCPQQSKWEAANLRIGCPLP